MPTRLAALAWPWLCLAVACATARVGSGDGTDAATVDAFAGDCSPPTPGLTGWSALGGPLAAVSAAGTPANLPSLAVDGDNTLLLAWVEGAPADVHVRRYADMTWQPMGAPISENPGETAVSTARLAARDDTAVVVLAEAGGVRGTGFYARQWVDSSWQRAGGGELSTENVSVTGGSVWIDPSGDFLVAWSQFGDGQVGRNRIRVVRFTSAAFQTLGPDIGGVSGATASAIAPQIVVDGAGAPIIAFSESGVRTVTRSGDEWAPFGPGEVSVVGSPAGAHSPQLALTPGGQPIIAVGEYEAQGDASNGYVLIWNDSDWEPVGGPLGADPAVMTNVSLEALAIDGGGRPVVAFTEGGNPKRLYVMRHGGDEAGFEPLGPQPMSAHDASTTVPSAALIVDLCGRPVIAFAEAEPGGDLAIHAFRYYD